MHDELFRRIEGKTDEVVALTRELIRIPTVNPPGEGYAACAEFLGRRLEVRGLEVGYHRAEGVGHPQAGGPIGASSSSSVNRVKSSWGRRTPRRA